MKSSNKPIDKKSPKIDSIDNTNKGYKKVTVVRVNKEIGSRNPASWTDSKAETRMTTNITIFSHLSWGVFLRIFWTRIILSLPSIVVPNGQIQPQKNRPRKTVKMIRITDGMAAIINVLAAIDADKLNNGFNRRKKSTGIFDVNG